MWTHDKPTVEGVFLRQKDGSIHLERIYRPYPDSELFVDNVISQGAGRRIGSMEYDGSVWHGPITTPFILPAGVGLDHLG